MRSILILGLACLACSTNDRSLEADSASSANAIKAQFAHTRFAADSAENAKKDSLDRIARQHADSEYATAYAAIRKLPPDSMDSIPGAVRSTLDARSCLIPQPIPGEKLNPVKGAFTAKGAVEWAVICALPRSTQALVIAESGTVTDSLSVAIDYTLGVLPRALLATRRIDDDGNSIPQPIDHDAIDVDILGKASVAYYRAAGNWYRIITSD